MDGGTIVGLIVAILMIIAHLVRVIREDAEAAKQPPPAPELMEDELILITRPKAVKQPKADQQRLTGRQSSKNLRSVPDARLPEPFKQQALTKKLSPQGEGRRFETDPGTLDTSRIVAPTFDPTVKPELESITGIYEQEATSIEKRPASAMTLDIADWLAKPEGICRAVILAEILNKPAWDAAWSRYSGV